MVKIVMVPSASATLKSMPVGVWEEFKYNEFKPAVIRSTATLLKKKGYLFECSDKDLITGIKVRRIK